MIEEFITFFKVNIPDEANEEQISKFMDNVTTHLNEHYSEEAVFTLMDIKGKPS